MALMVVDGHSALLFREAKVTAARCPLWFIFPVSRQHMSAAVWSQLSEKSFIMRNVCHRAAMSMTFIYGT